MALKDTDIIRKYNMSQLYSTESTKSIRQHTKLSTFTALKIHKKYINNGTESPV